MKRSILLVVAAAFPFLLIPAQPTEAQVQQWECHRQTVCNPWTGWCTVRTECCATIAYPDGRYVWECRWS